METVLFVSLKICSVVYPIALCGDAIQFCTGEKADVEIRWRGGDTASPAMADHDIKAFPAGAGDATRTKAGFVSEFCDIAVAFVATYALYGGVTDVHDPIELLCK